MMREEQTQLAVNASHSQTHTPEARVRLTAQITLERRGSIDEYSAGDTAVQSARTASSNLSSRISLS